MGISERMGDVLGQAVESKLLKEVVDHPVKVTHLAIIMDGNRRFAWKSNLATGLGHRIGKQKLETVLDWVLELEIPWFTVYALSTENLTRPKEELDTLFKLYIEGLKDIADDERIHKNEVKVQIIGRRELLPKNVNDAIDYAENKTADYDKFVFTVCLAYGSREEMLKAIQSIAEEHAAGDLPIEKIDEKAVSSRLYTGEMPDPDLVIRTSGEERISELFAMANGIFRIVFYRCLLAIFPKEGFAKSSSHFSRKKASLR